MADQMGILGSLGLNVDPESIYKQQKQEQYAKALGLAEGLGLKGPGEQGAANIGALLGARLSRPEGLTSDQLARVQTAKDAEARMKTWMADNKNATEEAKSLQYTNFLSEAAFDNGLPDVGAQAGMAAADRARAVRAKELELQKLGYTTDAAKYLPEMEKGRLAAIKRSGMADIFEYGETDPNKGRTAIINEDGSATVTATGETLPAGSYTQLRPMPASQLSGGRGAGGGKNMTPSEMGRMRELGAALYSKGRTYGDLRKVMQESFDTTGTTAALGNAGRMAEMVSRIGTDVYNMLAVLNPDATFSAVSRNGEEYSVDTTTGRRRMAREYATTIDKFLPGELKKTAEQAARARSLVVELMYLQARTSESGQKSFSDSDIERAAEVIGANVNNPKALAEIITSGYRRAYDEFGYRLLQVPEDTRPMIITRDALSQLADMHDKIMEDWDPNQWSENILQPDTADKTQSTLDYFLSE